MTVWEVRPEARDEGPWARMENCQKCSQPSGLPCLGLNRQPRASPHPGREYKKPRPSDNGSVQPCLNQMRLRGGVVVFCAVYAGHRPSMKHQSGDGRHSW
jgi:hypothetical protein